MGESQNVPVSLAQEIGFFAPNSWSLLWLVNGAAQLCTSKKDCNNLELTLVNHK
jgi:hypothetical protein